MDISSYMPDFSSSSSYKSKPTASEAAVEFESMIIKELLKTAREASEALGSESEMTGAANYHDFAERFLAREMAERGSLGFAELIEADLAKKASPE